MKIVIDCFGCDDPRGFTRGIPAALHTYEDIEVVACGPASLIRDYLGDLTFDRDRLEIMDAPDIITNEESPVEAIRRKPNSSLAVALKRMKTDPDCKALISAGSTGAVLVGSILLIGRCKGVARPGLAPLLPCDNGKMMCVCDSGANMDCKPEHLVEFARYGSRYMSSVYGEEAPAVGLLSVGVEEKKGNTLVKETHALLKDSGLNFIGNVEASEALSGRARVIVCDGFDGNLLLKSIEGTAMSVMTRMAGLMKKYAPEGTDMTFMKQTLGEMLHTLDAVSMAGAVLLGVKKIVIKAHGNSGEKTLPFTVGQARSMILGGYLKEEDL